MYAAQDRRFWPRALRPARFWVANLTARRSATAPRRGTAGGRTAFCAAHRRAAAGDPERSRPWSKGGTRARRKQAVRPRSPPIPALPARRARQVCCTGCRTRGVGGRGHAGRRARPPITTRSQLTCGALNAAADAATATSAQARSISWRPCRDFASWKKKDDLHEMNTRTLTHTARLNLCSVITKIYRSKSPRSESNSSRPAGEAADNGRGGEREDPSRAPANTRAESSARGRCARNPLAVPPSCRDADAAHARVGANARQAVRHQGERRAQRPAADERKHPDRHRMSPGVGASVFRRRVAVHRAHAARLERIHRLDETVPQGGAARQGGLCKVLQDRRR